MELMNSGYFPILFAIVERSLAVWATFHAVLRKSETSSVIGWVGLIWLSPLVGTLAYFVLGVNRIERKGEKILHELKLTAQQSAKRSLRERIWDATPFCFDSRLASVGKKVTGFDLLPGNRVFPLIGGKCAYPEMLHAISDAKSTISVCSYIFDYDKAGKLFIAALLEAQQRGVEVRILIDHVGSRYSKPSAVTFMRKLGLRVQTFLPTYRPQHTFYANLRNHRKLMVIDGMIGFTGGMNIREGCFNEPGVKHPIQDVHFRFEGPVVEHMQEVFLADWYFVTNEELPVEKWFSNPLQGGEIWARGIPDGPDADIDNIRLIMLGAIAVAQQRIDVVTPYFLPDSALIGALKVAAMRGVRVRILLPDTVNIRSVQWASRDPIFRLLERGVEVYESPPPFDHTKILLVDDAWTLVGSSNWDPRSLRLNFEFNVECYGTALNAELSQLIENKLEIAQPLTLDMLNQRPLLIKLRDGVARLGTPYL